MTVHEDLRTGPDTAEWSLWSVTARIVVTDSRALADARARAEEVLGAVDRAASRFRLDSELMLVQHLASTGVDISPLLTDLIEAALDAARLTDGAVDPTVGGRLFELGYDRDIAELSRPSQPSQPSQPSPLSPLSPVSPVSPLSLSSPSPLGHNRQAQPIQSVVTHPAPNWRTVELRRTTTGGRLTMPAGTRLDLGATAKAYAADRCAAMIGEDTGVLVSLGGDIATAGPAPAGGWHVLVQDRPEDPAQTIGLPAGAALATSSTVSRRWSHRGLAMHHIIDPRTGTPASTRWRSASVAAATCLQANAASTAALVHGDGAPAWLRRTGLPARLVGADGRVRHFGGWPAGHGEDRS
jgi:FAD:protein FMN transferase